MTQKFTFCLFFTVFVTLIYATDGIAQDGNAPVEGYSSPSYQERNQYTPGGEDTPPAGKVKPQPIIAKDSAIVKPTVRPEFDTDPSKVDSEDESVISFNFLYYIIRKYKLQDIVD